MTLNCSHLFCTYLLFVTPENAMLQVSNGNNLSRKYDKFISMRLETPCGKWLSSLFVRRFTSTSKCIFILQRLVRCALFSALLTLFFCFSAVSIASAGITGNVESTNGGIISGWVLDTSASSHAVTVSIYMDGPTGVGKLQTSFTTSVLRSDVNSGYKTSGYHGFQWGIPKSQQGAVHIWFVYASGTSTAAVIQNSPTVYPPVSAAMTGAAQPLVLYSTAACTPDDVPDHPARAFRTADGNVTLLASHINARRAVGTNLNTVQHSCTVVHTSESDMTFADFRYYQWLQTPYTLDGKTIYMVTHNEWYGSNIKPSCNGDELDSWVSAVTFLVSTNGGASYTRPLDYLVRNPTTPWNNNMPCTPSNPTRYGDLGGSNIVYNSGYYYRFFIYEPEPNITSNKQWQCIMRSTNISSASSWFVWTGSGWVNSKTSSCAPVPFVQNIRSVTYNTYINMYVGIQDINGNVVFNLSHDLLNWSSPTTISTFGIDLTQLVYPSLLDPSDTTINFERSGQSPYIYYTRLNNNISRDLMRFPLKFTISGK